MIYVLVTLWLVFAFVPPVIAQRKGRSFLGFLLLSLVFSPLVGLIAVLIVMPDREALKGAEQTETPFNVEEIPGSYP